MSNVTLSIGGRTFAVACAEGEENHVAGLGAMIDGKLAAMGDMAGQSESRMLLFAALLLADDLHDARPARAASDSGEDLVLAARLESLAGKLETIATQLEN